MLQRLYQQIFGHESTKQVNGSIEDVPVSKSKNLRDKIPMHSANAESSAPEGFISVYLVYTTQNRRGQKYDTNIKEFFNRLQKNEQTLTDHPLFLSEDLAFEYTRFLDENHMIIKALVDETAIEGCKQSLILRQGTILGKHIQGCIPVWKSGGEYLLNPNYEIPM